MPSTDRLRRRSAAFAVAAVLGMTWASGAVEQGQSRQAEGARASWPGERYDVMEKTIAELQDAMQSGSLTSSDLVTIYLARIAAYDQEGPALNALISLNPRALEEAAALDRERAARGSRGPLHGIPVLVKDNFDMVGLPTTAGSLALANLRPTTDAFQVARLRAAGAVILGKTNLHELASGITTVSSLGGQTRNPYDPTRNPGGSSGGTGAAIAANFAVAGLGTDTCGSIRIPAAHNSLVGLRADAWAIQSRRDRSALALAGRCGTARENRRRRGGPARRDRRDGSGRSFHERRGGTPAADLS